MKATLVIMLLITSLSAQAGEIASCLGTVLQRRFALVQFGRLTDAYIAAKGALPDICAAPVPGISDAIPDLLKDASVCGSSEKGAVYYSCQIPTAPSSADSLVIETCHYALADQSVSCENKTVMTTFEESKELPGL